MVFNGDVLVPSVFQLLLVLDTLLVLSIWIEILQVWRAKSCRNPWCAVIDAAFCGSLVEGGGRAEKNGSGWLIALARFPRLRTDARWCDGRSSERVGWRDAM